jgi:cold shock CspA family protein
MQAGICVFWLRERGFGFIEPVVPLPSGESIFVHCSELPGKLGRRNLTAGQRVWFEIGEAPNGRMAAVNVQYTEPPPQTTSEAHSTPAKSGVL